MQGIVLFLGIVICGYFNLTLWILVPASIAAAFVGAHYPPGKAQIAKERGVYWGSILYSLPLHAIVMAILYGIGWGISALIH